MFEETKTTQPKKKKSRNKSPTFRLWKQHLQEVYTACIFLDDFILNQHSKPLIKKRKKQP